MARSGVSTRPVSAVSTICDGHQHICKEGLFNPVAIVYNKAPTTDLHVKCLPDSTLLK